MAKSCDNLFCHKLVLQKFNQCWTKCHQSFNYGKQNGQNPALRDWLHMGKMRILANYVYVCMYVCIYIYIYLYVYVADDLLCNQCWLGYSAFHHLVKITTASNTGWASRGFINMSLNCFTTSIWCGVLITLCRVLIRPKHSWSSHSQYSYCFHPFALVNVPSVAGRVSLWFAKLTLVTIVQLPLSDWIYKGANGEAQAAELHPLRPLSPLRPLRPLPSRSRDRRVLQRSVRSNRRSRSFSPGSSPNKHGDVHVPLKIPI